MICQSCGIQAPTKQVTFYQNIGLLILRLTLTVEGEFCKPCVHTKFWTASGITAVCGWWGVISFFVTPAFLILNTIQYGLCLVRPFPADPETDQRLPAELADRIRPYAAELFRSLNRGEDLETVARAVAIVAGVTPAQVRLYARTEAPPREN